jgi:hypothetical protein
MKVTKLFEITFDEPDPDWLCADNLNIVLKDALEPLTFEIRELTNREQYLEKFNIGSVFDLRSEEITVEEIGLDTGIEEKEEKLTETPIIHKPLINVAEKNAVLRAAKGSGESISSKIKSVIKGAKDVQDLSSGEDIIDPKKLVAHIAPGPSGKICEKPKRHKEKIPGGGAIEFCTTCGFQYVDTDLLE